MDDRLRERVQGFVEQLLKEEKSSLRKAQTFLEIENLAIEVGDEIARRLASGDLSKRSQEAADQEQFHCPECGRRCAVEQDHEPLILQGRRGEIEYSEPRCHCRSCRRDFFPSRGTNSASGAGNRHPSGSSGRERIWAVSRRPATPCRCWRALTCRRNGSVASPNRSVKPGSTNECNRWPSSRTSP